MFVLTRAVGRGNTAKFIRQEISYYSRGNETLRFLRCRVYITTAAGKTMAGNESEERGKSAGKAREKRGESAGKAREACMDDVLTVNLASCSTFKPVTTSRKAIDF